MAEGTILSSVLTTCIHLSITEELERDVTGNVKQLYKICPTEAKRGIPSETKNNIVHSLKK